MSKLIRATVHSLIDKRTFKAEYSYFVVDKKYRKRLPRSKFYLVDYDSEDIIVGSQVFIQETRPVSKRKSWKLSKVLNTNN